MKKVTTFLAAASIIATTSCKKEYICTCVFPFEGQEPFAQEYIAKAINKKNAQEKCDIQQQMSLTTNTVCTINE